MTRNHEEERPPRTAAAGSEPASASPVGWCSLKDLPPVYREAFETGWEPDGDTHTFPTHHTLSLAVPGLLHLALPLLFFILAVDYVGWKASLQLKAILLLFSPLLLVLVPRAIGSIREIVAISRERRARKAGRHHFAALVGPDGLAIRPFKSRFGLMRCIFVPLDALAKFELVRTERRSMRADALWIAFRRRSGKLGEILLGYLPFGSEEESRTVVAAIRSASGLEKPAPPAVPQKIVGASDEEILEVLRGGNRFKAYVIALKGQSGKPEDALRRVKRLSRRNSLTVPNTEDPEYLQFCRYHDNGTLKRRPRRLLFEAVGYLLGFTFCIWMAYLPELRTWLDARTARDWLPTEGLVTDSECAVFRKSTSLHTGSSRRHGLRVQYAYSVDGRSYRSDQLTLGSKRRVLSRSRHHPWLNVHRPDDCRALRDGRFSPGTAVTVYYDPGDPGDAYVLRKPLPEQKRSMRFALWLAAFL
ncbi:MAG: DUF3592 domain-containing protein [Thermoanaerobaculia bacterium]|nr:DUF3592 domain-containing protein [Thermoanaerobaculia bacterium]